MSIKSREDRDALAHEELKDTQLESQHNLIEIYQTEMTISTSDAWSS